MSDADKPEGRQGNDNPWYCLATLHGEQAGRPLNLELHAKNRRAWNRWIAGALSDEQRAELVKKGFPTQKGMELAPLSPEEKSAFFSAFAARTGRENGLPPEPAYGADFSHTHFDRKAVFDGFLFKALTPGSFGDANFSAATFSSDASFRSATFSGIANFGPATFSGEADFSAATFSGYAIFVSATFSGLAKFGAATFGDAHFRSATFSGHVDFVDAKFAAFTTFADAGFETFVPDFRGATMHEATEWHGVSWPKPPRDKDAAQAQIYAYERLKQEMERLKKHEDEQQFFRRELRARRGLVPWSGEWLLNVIYEASSDYGLSINRPLLRLFWLFALGSSILTETPAFNNAPMTIANAAKHSFANIFPFLPLKQDIIAVDKVAVLSPAAQIIAVAQSLLGPLLPFLLGLALRNRFRMK
jgi:hypothetical protein